MLIIRKVTLAVLLAVCTLPTFAYQHIVSCTLIQTQTKENFEKTLEKRHLPKSMVPIKNTVDVYDITYYTKWHDGTTIKASGLYYLPRDSRKPVAELLYDHGTRITRDKTRKPGGEESICLAFAMDGYAVMQPDYIGLGTGDKFHLYQHAESEGQAGVDMIFAARELDDSLHVRTSGQLFLTGYSQGGHASLATLRLIEQRYADRVHVTAASPMSGAYDMCGVQGEVMFHPYSRPHYLPYLLSSYNEVYHFVPDINQIYKHPYDSLVPLLFDGRHSINAIDKQLPAVPKDMIADKFLNAFVADSNHPLRIALRENSLCDWAPQAPVQLCYCDSDQQVTPLNAIVAYKTMKSMGARHVTLREVAKDLNHGSCAPIAALYTKMYFDSFRRGKKYGGKGPVKEQIVAGIAKRIVEKKAQKDREKKKEKEQHMAGQDARPRKEG
ncbi:MAG: hypothetical protein JST83_17615 [Bacteroidetes bacterium]|nr:hypothetical protein [Bacteroidota bacterium]